MHKYGKKKHHHYQKKPERGLDTCSEQNIDAKRNKINWKIGKEKLVEACEQVFANGECYIIDLEKKEYVESQ